MCGSSRTTIAVVKHGCITSCVLQRFDSTLNGAWHVGLSKVRRTARRLVRDLLELRHGPGRHRGPGFSDPADRGAVSDRMVVTTTPGVEGRRIVRYCGLVAGETILQPNSFRHF